MLSPKLGKQMAEFVPDDGVQVRLPVKQPECGQRKFRYQLLGKGKWRPDMADNMEQYVRVVPPAGMGGDLLETPGHQVDIVQKCKKLRFPQVWIPRQ